MIGYKLTAINFNGELYKVETFDNYVRRVWTASGVEICYPPEFNEDLLERVRFAHDNM